MKSFKFKNIKKVTWPVEMPDGTQLTIRQPTKADADVLASVLNTTDIEEIYAGVAYILNCNQEGIMIEQKELEQHFDFQDLAAFLQGYTDFLNESSNVKN